MPIVKAWGAAEGGDLFDYIEALKRKEKIEEIRSRATLVADFANNSYLVYEGITDNLTSRPFNDVFNFTRNSIATGENSLGLIEETGVDQHRLVGKREGLLVEESRENLLTYSEEFDNADWSKDGVTVTANDIVAPDGSTTADKIVEDGSNGFHEIEFTLSGLSTTDYAESVFAKAGERTVLGLITTDPVTAVLAEIDLSNGTVLQDNTGTLNVVPYPNGWYRISGIYPPSQSTSNLRFHLIENATGDVVADRTYTGDGTSGLYIWGAQLEEGSLATSYIPTAASSVVRDTDDCVRTLGTEFNADALTAYLHITSLDEASNTSAGVAYLGSNRNEFNLIQGGGQFGFYVDLRELGGSRNFVNVTGWAQTNVTRKFAVTVKRTGEWAAAVDGVLAASGDEGVTLDYSVITTINVARRNNLGAAFSDVKDFYLFPEALTADELKTLTEPD